MASRTRPGVIIYFDMRPAIERLSDEQRGKLLMAILNYAERGEITELDDMTGMCFDLVRPKLDYDENRYERAVAQRRYAVYVREAQKRNDTPLSFDDWLMVSYRPLSTDNG